MPYGWQFLEEEVFMPCRKGTGLNCFALLSRANECWFETTTQRLTSGFIVEQLERYCRAVGAVLIFSPASDRRGAGQCAGAQVQASAGAPSVLARAWVVSLLSAALLTASQHCRDVVAQAEI